MRLCLTAAVVVVSLFIRKCVVGQKTTTYNDDYEVDESIRVRHLYSEVQFMRQLMIVQERQLFEMRSLLEAVHRFMDQLLFNYSLNDCFRSQSTLRRSSLQSDTRQTYQVPAAADNTVSLIARLDINDRWIYGVTKLNSSIYILCYSPNSILVTEDRAPFAPFALKEIETPQIRNPYNVVASQPWNCLFVIDIGSHCIWQVSGTDYSISLWLTGLSHVTALSVTSDGRVLVINQDADTSSSQYLEIYGRDALLTDRIQLHNLGAPLNAVQTSRGSYIVCYKTEDEEDGDIWWISELDANGTRMNTFYGDDEVETMLFEPSHLFIDSNDRLFVADRRGNRVSLIDAQLNWNQTVLSEAKDGIQSPLRVHYDDNEHQLIVVFGAGGGEKVDIYSFQFP